MIAVLGGFTLAVTLLIWPAGALTPADMGNVWAPFATVLAAYGPFFYRQDRRVAIFAVALLTVIVARPWQPSVAVITVGVLRTAVGPLLALYFGARHALLRSLRERAERAERERYLLAEQARTEERARLAGEMHDVVTHRVSLMVLQAGALRMTAPDEPTRQAGGGTAGGRLPGPGRAARPGRDPARAPDGDEAPFTDGLAALVAESASGGHPGRADRGRRSRAGLAGGRPDRLPHRPGGADQRAQARARRAGDRAGQLRRHAGAARGPQHRRAATAADLSGLAGTGSGLGLAQLRQRVELVHGTLRAGPAPDGGFCVEATLPAYVPTAEPVA